MAYVMSVDNFRFEKEADELVVTSYTDDFRSVYEWPEDLSITDEGLDAELYERFYHDVLDDYDSFES